MSDVQRLIVKFRGRVQGVGFRQTASEIAEQFSVTGTVQNLPDGAVKLIVEGEMSEIKLFLEAIEKRMGRHIQSTTQQGESATGGFTRFGVIG